MASIISELDSSPLIRTKLEHYHKLIEETLYTLLEKNELVFEAARYSVFSGGKRIRPLLCLATAEALGGDLNKALVPAATLEMIHTYSLIHDDLPGMDNDDYRRGKSTLHKVYPEGIAILTGDFLLTYAFESLTKAPLLTAEQKIAMINSLSNKSGAEGMIGGQAIDLTQSLTTQNEIDTLHAKKTGALIQAACELGALAAGADAKAKKALSSFSQKIGLAFQIMDDVIDVTHSLQKHGKAVSSDLINQKTTYASLLGVEDSKREAVNLLNSATHELDDLKLDFSLLKYLANSLIFREI